MSHIITNIKYSILYTKHIVNDYYTRHKLCTYKTISLFMTLCFLWQSIKLQYPTIQYQMQYTEMLFWWSLYWIILGILSSVGLGTGFHTGILFLVPHIVKTCKFAFRHQTLDFDTIGPHAFQLETISDNYTSDGLEYPLESNWITFTLLFFKVYGTVFCWAIGTAIGEIPPYLFSRACLAELDIMAQPRLRSMMEWMLEYLQKYGFWVILIFSGYPNMFFDLCGICCGLLNMKFIDFFIPLLIGKVLIKSTYQTMFFVMISSKSFLQNTVLSIESHLGKNISHSTKEWIIQLETGYQNPGEEHYFKYIWNLFLCGLTLRFVYSTIVVMANKYKQFNI